jgi:hypothetical protein
MNYLKYFLVLFFLGSMVSCEDYFGDNANVDPDNPTVATANILLPQVQVRLAYTYGGDFTRYLGLNTQHIDGVSRQFAVLGQYGIVPSDVDTPWANIYVGTLNSNKQLFNLATENGYNHYAGMALALETYAIMIATDFWGDIPYSDAFQFGERGVYSPTFDTQEAIYAQLFSNLDQARTLLGSDDGGNAPGNDDFMYGGDASQWIKFCNVLEARGQLHLSKRSGNGAYTAALAALGGGRFESAGDEAAVPFGNNATENSPWFQYIEQRDDCETGATYIAMLESLNDPRIATYGLTHDNSHPIWTKDQPVKLLSFTEQEFIRAEAMLGSDPAGAYDAFLSGIAASFDEALMSSDDYDAYVAQGSIGVGADNLTLENIMTQKYLALYTSPEVFNDWRRTGLPVLSPVTGTEIPRRLPYAEAEEFANDNTPSPTEISIFDRVWWDQ